jgi:dipeptidase
MDLPFSVKPDSKLSLRDVMELTRDKSAGTPFDPVRGVRGGPFKNPNYYRGTRLISVPNVEYTTLTQCRDWLPAMAGGIVWVALGAQDTSCYVPFYAGVTEIPRSFSVGDHWVLNRDAARWAFDYVDFHAQVAYSSAIADVREARKTWEDGAVARIPEVDKKAAELFQKNPKEAVRFLTGFCLTNAQDVVRAWWKLGDDLWVKYNHLGMYDAGKRQTGRLAPADAETWNKAVRVFDALTEPDVKK